MLKADVKAHNTRSRDHNGPRILFVKHWTE